MQSQGTVDIAGPCDEVFRLTTDHVEQWSSVVVENEVVDQAPDGVGTLFRTVTLERGHRMEFEGIVTCYEPPHRNSVHMESRELTIDVDYTFEPIDGGTRVTQSSHVTGNGMMRLLLPVIGWFMARSNVNALDRELQGLKQFCESRIGPSEP